MTAPIIGIIVSASCIVVLTLLFRMEHARGARVLGGMRERLDQGAIAMEESFEKTVRYIGREMPRQSLHYFFHTVLTSILHFLRRCEVAVTSALRSNRIMARRIQNERTTRNKLDEIADHKAAVAMSDEEKRKHRARLLEGK